MKLHGLKPVASLDAPHSGGASGTHPKQWRRVPLRQGFVGGPPFAFIHGLSPVAFCKGG
ncbi:hypothetical protein HY087_01945 [Candidatus Gottesmanbacteria bacterium]|nr:hypothetical protein [Candidatus Gottesmanbacteria bacterium]